MSENEAQKGPDGSCKGCTRRGAFVKLGVGSIAVASSGALVFGYEFLSPNVLYEPSPIVNAGKPDRYPPGSVTQDLETGIYIVHGPEGIYAMSAVCTHLGCLTVWNEQLGIVACPCHGSKFQRDGTKIEGPAPRPLIWLQTSLNEDGELLVDRSIEMQGKEFVKA